VVGRYLTSSSHCAISDAGWVSSLRCCGPKRKTLGGFGLRSTRHTSDRCDRCTHAARENRVTQVEFACQHRGHSRARCRWRGRGRGGPSGWNCTIQPKTAIDKHSPAIATLSARR